jgi:uncharacterized membrane protein
MTWIVFALSTAVCESLKDVFSKKGLANIDEYVIAWSLRFFALPFLLPILFFVKLPALAKDFWLALIPIMLYKSPRAVKQIPVVFKKLLPIGFFCALTVIFQMLAVSLTLVAHVIAIKRTSTVMSVGWGHFIFKEEGLRKRLLRASIMIVGVLLISLF